ncbi:hypothetical protein ANCDUO_05481 [Ancylostoma duodenale]|uniref:Uncharacterized protein n=1 Tax=Ancylostoma duodenale TaxID=51022 RepID=A0A0C2GYK0_9BILA|nr:hypothetical protein ANCDUO_05481 [Ancylostoma duodenale]
MNQTSPMIDELRAKLQQANWARAGLGLPLLPELDPPPLPPQQTHLPASSSLQKSSQFTAMANGGHFPAQGHANRYFLKKSFNGGSGLERLLLKWL